MNSMRKWLRLPVVLGVLLPLLLGSVNPAGVPVAHAAGTWTATGSLLGGRTSHTATLLPSGKVLVAGGAATSCCSQLASAELYDPATGTFSPTGSMGTGRIEHTATLLPSGKVLVAGGLNHSLSWPFLASAELYDPAAGTWTATGSMGAGTGRRGHTATLLPSGKVLVTGGLTTCCDLFASAELYDPAAGTWTATGSMGAARLNHTATLLPNGKILIAGGRATVRGFLASAELYDPAAGTFTATGSMAAVRYAHSATLLASGKTLVAGGFGSASSFTASAELYDPAAGTFTATGSMAAARAFHTATLLANGKLLVAGGSANLTLASAELYDPAAGTFTATGSMAAARYDHSATLLASGKLLVAGGRAFLSFLASAELYDELTINCTLTLPTIVAGPGIGLMDVDITVTCTVTGGSGGAVVILASVVNGSTPGTPSASPPGPHSTQWNVGTFDTDGKVRAISGATYTFTYQVTDNAGNVATFSGTITVP